MISPERKAHTRSGGFTILELLVVVAIILTLVAVSIPLMSNAMATARLQETGVGFGNLLQEARISAIRQNVIYSVRVDNTVTPNRAYVDQCPLNANGTAGSGAYAACTNGDTVVQFGSDVTAFPPASAPDTASTGCTNNCTDLTDQVIPGGGIGLTDASSSSNDTSHATFTARGLPCNSTATAIGGCADANPVAYGVAFQSSTNHSWGAVTITPAGRVQIWTHPTSATGGKWTKQ